MLNMNLEKKLWSSGRALFKISFTENFSISHVINFSFYVPVNRLINITQVSLPDIFYIPWIDHAFRKRTYELGNLLVKNRT